jgi:NitT/TauT family transport system substrate-binding protein
MRTTSSSRWLRFGAIATLATVMVTGCSSNTSGGGGGSSSSASGTTTANTGSLTKVKVGLAGALASAMPLYVGEADGIFKKYGLDVEPSVLPQGGPALVPAVLSGSVQFASTTAVSVMLAHSTNVAVKVIAPAESGGTVAADDPSELSSLASSGITSVSQLAGKAIGIISLKGIQQLQASAILDKAGIDPTKAHFVAIPSAQMASALTHKRVAAVMFQEPFLTEAAADTKLNDLAAGSVGTTANLPGAQFIASDKMISSNPALVRKFQLAVKEAYTYASAHPSEVRQALVKNAGLAASLASKIKLPVFATAYNEAGIQTIIDLSTKYKFISKSFKASEILAPFPLPA